MGDRYYYNSGGGYRGRSSDDGPCEWIVYAVISVFILLVINGC